MLKETSKEKFGIMCGRLSRPRVSGEIQVFPYHCWSEEFPLYEKLGFSSCEWIVDSQTLDHNPILQPQGREQIKELMTKHNVAVDFLMAQYFVDRNFVESDKVQMQNNKELLISLLQASNDIGIKMIEIPLLEKSELKTEKHMDHFITVLTQEVIPLFEECGVILSLETSLDPMAFVQLLSKIHHPLVKATFDMGNSAHLNYDPMEEIQALSPWLINVHVKDKAVSGESVPLGEGQVNFEKVFTTLESIGYEGVYVLETYKDTSRSDMGAGIREYLDYLEKYTGKNYVKR